MALGLVLAAAVATASPDPSHCGAVQASAAGSAAGTVTGYTADCFTASSPNTALDMVNHLPGFSFDSGSTVRGFGGAAGNVIIDGARPASKDDPLDEILKRIPAGQVLRIDVIRGGAPGVDMQGKTVIANVIRRQGGGLKLTLAGAANFVPDGRVEPSMRVEGSKRFGATELDWGLLLGRGADDGSGDGPRVIRDATGAVVAAGPEHTKGEGATRKLTLSMETPLAGGKLRLNSTLDSEPYRFSQHDVFTTAAASFQSEEDRQDKDSFEIGGRYERAFGEHLRWETFALQKWTRNNFFADVDAAGDDQQFALRRTGGESILRSLLRRSFGPTLDLEAGAEGDYNFQNSRTSFVDGGVAVPLPAANVRVTETRGEAFGTATWRGLPHITVETGIRLEASRIRSTGDVESARSLFFPKPRAVITWAATAHDQVRFRVEREVGQLDFDDFAASAALLGSGVQVGNPNIDPERDWVLEGAIDHRFWGDSLISVTGRHYLLNDVIDRAPDPSGLFDAPGNIGSGTKDELAVNLTLNTDRIGLKRGQFQLQSTWRWSSVIDPTTHTAREISKLRPVEWEAHYTQGIPRLKSTIGFDVFGQWRERYYRFDEIDTNRLKTWVDVFIEYKPRPDMSLRVEYDNMGARGFEFVRQVWPGPRNAAALSQVDVRDTSFGRIVYVRFRKTFG
ncbi:MAG TPA: TonB-dependent receptor [Caulobacteraceae bacterium]|nr:TonB-dependent receptor [Caulobacteraceae bacterium]